MVVRRSSILFIVLAGLLVACSGRGLESEIIGRWEGDSTDGGGVTLPAMWEFFEDGTVIVTIDTAVGASAVAGLYQFEDEDTIIILEQEGDTDPGRRDIRMPNDDTLILTAPVSGAQDVLRRMAEGGATVAAEVPPAELATVEPVAATETRPVEPATATAQPAPTASPTVTATPTLVPLGEIDLGPLLIVEGDLPDNLDGELVEYGATGRFDRDSVARPENLVSQGFYDLEAERPGGNVIVYAYEDAAIAGQVYGEIASEMNGLLDEFGENRDDVGERARLENNGNDNLHLAFLRCGAFVEVFMQTPREFDIVSYAQRLDERLAAVICRE